MAVSQSPHRSASFTGAAPAGHDVVVVGARVAGASTALLLARRGLRVLLLDGAAAPGTDTLSTHALLPGGVARLQRWGLLDGLRASSSPTETMETSGRSVRWRS